jgi:peptide deformylase
MFELEAQDILGVCIQHEIDHLDGILFVDHLSKLKQKRLLEKTKKAQK